MDKLTTYPSCYETLVGLVRNYSPTGEVDQAADWLVQQMKNIGFTQSFRDGFGNPTGIMGTGENQIVFLGHIDTVSGEIPVELRGDDLYGRGSVDAKGPLAAFTDAVAAMGSLDDWQFIVIGAIDEEGDSQAAKFLLDRYQPKYTIIGEPSDWRRITIGYKGSCSTTFQFSQPLVHSASRVATSCEKAFMAWNKVVDWTSVFNQQRQRAFEQVSPSLMAMSSGKDGFMQWAKIEMNTRLPIEVSPDQWEKQIKVLTKDMDIELSMGAHPIPAFLASKNTPLVRAFLQSIRSQGEQPGFVVKTGTSDMNIVAPAWQCPILAYGPGNSNLDHAPEEHINLHEYDLAVAVIKHSILNLVSHSQG